MMNGLYTADVLALAANIKHVGRLDTPDGTSRKVSKLCGSWVEVDICLNGDIVSEFAIRLQACALGQASAAILAEQIIGANADEVRDAREALKAMLKRGGTPPGGRFSKLEVLQEVKDYPARHTSTMLAFDSAVQSIDQTLDTAL